MAARLDANTDYFSRTVNLVNHNGAYTFMGWFWWTGAGATRHFVVLTGGPAQTDWQNSDFVGVNSANRFRLSARIGGSTNEILGTTLSNDTWYHVAMVRESATALKGYINGVLDITDTNDITGRVATAGTFVGILNNTSLNGRFFGLKEFASALTAAEIQREMHIIPPRHVVHGWWPVFAGAGERVRDYSGGGNWTENGTVVDEDPPPVSWGAPLQFILPSAPSVLLAFRAETVRFADTSVRAIGLARLFTEIFQAAEGIVRAHGQVRAVAETAQVSEGRLTVRGVRVLLGEILQLTEVLRQILGRLRLTNESISVPEIARRVLGLTRTQAETLRFPEAGAFIRGLRRSSAETAQYPETIVRNLGLRRVFVETLQWIGEAGRGIRGVIRLFSEAAQWSETVRRALGLRRILNDTVNETESIFSRLGFVRRHNETWQYNESRISGLGRQRMISETTQYTEVSVFRRGLMRIRTETASWVEAIRRLIQTSVVYTTAVNFAVRVRAAVSAFFDIRR